MEIRISVANLVPRLIVQETCAIHFLGLLNRRHASRGNRIYGALGGAAELTQEGKQILHKQFGAKFEKGQDARFLVQKPDVDRIMPFFERRDVTFCESNPDREIREELTTAELPNLPRILTEQDVARIQVQYAKSIYPTGSLENTRHRFDSDGILSIHYFHLFEIIVPESIFERLRMHPAIQIFTENDLATTQMGRVRGISANGSVISSNLFW